MEQDEIIEIEAPDRMRVLGCTAYPRAVVYVIDGFASLLPPETHDVVYRQRVLNRRAFERLVQTGAIYHSDHTGRKQGRHVDGRRAPGA